MTKTISLCCGAPISIRTQRVNNSIYREVAYAERDHCKVCGKYCEAVTITEPEYDNS